MTETEKKAIELFDARFGRCPVSRFKKIKEEFKEAKEAARIVFEGSEHEIYEGQTERQRMDHLRDEVSDLYATVSHFASLLNLYHDELLEMAVDKVIKRQTDKNYKRF